MKCENCGKQKSIFEIVDKTVGNNRTKRVCRECLGIDEKPFKIKRRKSKSLTDLQRRGPKYTPKMIIPRKCGKCGSKEFVIFEGTSICKLCLRVMK